MRKIRPVELSVVPSVNSGRQDEPAFLQRADPALRKEDEPLLRSARQKIFEAMSRNAGRSVDFFGIPPNAVIELGTRVQL